MILIGFCLQVQDHEDERKQEIEARKVLEAENAREIKARKALEAENAHLNCQVHELEEQRQ
jgi:hypothetical protein